MSSLALGSSKEKKKGKRSDHSIMLRLKQAFEKPFWIYFCYSWFSSVQKEKLMKSIFLKHWIWADWKVRNLSHLLNFSNKSSSNSMRFSTGGYVLAGSGLKLEFASLQAWSFPTHFKATLHNFNTDARESIVRKLWVLYFNLDLCNQSYGKRWKLTQKPEEK